MEHRGDDPGLLHHRFLNERTLLVLGGVSATGAVLLVPGAAIYAKVIFGALACLVIVRRFAGFSDLGGDALVPGSFEQEASVSHHVGRSTVQKIFETRMEPMGLDRLLPEFPRNAVRDHPDWFPAGSMDVAGDALMSVHVWLVRHDGRIILIDAGAGNAKVRPDAPDLDRLSTRFLDRLAQAGVAPDAVDLIILTHIHPDHVGWCTQLDGENWVPTFPNATLVVSDREYRYLESLAAGDGGAVAVIRDQAGLGAPVREPPTAPFLDSVQPLAGLVPIRRVVPRELEIVPGLRYFSTPGHSIDHASIELTSAGQIALFSGDVLHHPVEVRAPGVVTSFCEFPEAARRSRRRFLDHAGRTGARVFTSHFPRSSVGIIDATADGWTWRFVSV